MSTIYNQENGGTGQQPSARRDFKKSGMDNQMIEAIVGKIDKINIMLNGGAPQFDVNVECFELRNLINDWRRLTGYSNSAILRQLDEKHKERLSSIVNSVKSDYMYDWVMRNPNKVKAQHKSPDLKEQRNKIKRDQLSIQQNRKLKRVLFQEALTTGIEYQGMKPEVIMKTEDCMNKVGDLAASLNEFVTLSIKRGDSEVSLPAAIGEIVANLGEVTDRSAQGLNDLSYLIEAFVDKKTQGTDRAAAIKQIVDDCFNSLNSTKEAIIGAKEQYSSMLEQFKTLSVAFLEAVAFGMFIQCGLGYIYNGSKIYATLAIVSGMFMAYRAGSGTFIVFEQLRSFFSTGVKPQMDVGMVSQFVNLIFSICHISTADRGKMDKLASYLSSAERRNCTLETLLENTKDAGLYILNCILGSMGLSKIYSFKTGVDECSDGIFNIYESILKRKDTDSYVYDDTTYAELMDLQDKCALFLRTTRETKDNRGLLKQVWAVQAFCVAERKIMADTHWQSSGYRAEPVCLVLTGEPGVGKTQTVEFVCMHYCQTVLPESEMPRLWREGTAPFTYIRQDENEFWEGYKNRHIITVFDDLGQRRTVPGGDDAFFNVIRAINSFPYQLHMAEMTKKENTMFTSRLVIATTNLDRFEPNTLYSSEAIDRRLKFRFRVIVREEYAMSNGALDVTKLDLLEDGTPSFDPQKTNLYISTDFDGNPIERGGRTTHTFEQMMELVYAESFLKEKMRESKVKILHKHMVELIKKRGLSDMYEEHNEKYVIAPQAKQKDDRSYAAWKEDKVHDMYAELKFQDLCELYRQRYRYFSKNNVPCDIIENSMLYNYLLTGKFEFLNWTDGTIVMMQEKHLIDMWKKQNGIGPYCDAIYDFFLASKNWFVRGIYRFVNAISHSAYIVAMGICKMTDVLGVPLTTFLISFSISNAIYWPVVYRKWKRAQKEQVDLQALSMEHSDYYDSIMPQYEPKRGSRTSLKVRARVHRSIKNQGRVEHIEDVENLVLEHNIYAFFYQKKNSVGKQISPNDFSGINSINSFVDSELATHFMQAGFLIAFKGRHAVIPRHFYEVILDYLDEGEEFANQQIVMVPCKGRSVQTCTFLELIEGGIDYVPDAVNDVYDQDRIVIELPRHIKMHRDITKHFISEKEIDYSASYDVTLTTFHASGLSQRTGMAKSIVDKPACIWSNTCSTTLLEQGWVYRLKTVVGDCGGLLTGRQGPKSICKILGIHVAGEQGRQLGFGQIITREWLENIDAPSDALTEVEYGIPAETLAGIIPQANMEYIGKVKRKHNVYGNTKLRKSRMHPDNIETPYASTLKPARIKPYEKDGQIVDPYHKALLRYCAQPNISLPMPNLNRAVETVTNHMLKFERSPRTFSFFEAVAGVTGDPCFGPISRSTSAGYPYNVLGVTKKMIFGDGQEYTFETQLAQDVLSKVEEVILLAKAGKRSFHVYTDNLKDETLPIAKVEIGKTRMFCGAPLVYTIACRMYFGAFMSYMQSKNIELGHAIGLNPYGVDWHLLAMKLIAKAKDPMQQLFGAGDYSAFDASEVPFVHWKILDLINRWYADENDRVRAVLWEDLVNSKHISGEDIYSWCGSLPSGHPLTSIVNSIYNHVAMVFCFYNILEQHDLEVYGDFYDHVYLCVMGDDNIFAVDPEFAELFNETKIGLSMSKLGLTYTSDTKGALNIALRKLEDISFLKRKFRREKDLKTEGVYMFYCAPLDLTFLETPHWYHLGVEHELSILKSNVEFVLRELSLHGKQIFESHCQQVRKLYFKAIAGTAVVEQGLKYSTFEAARVAVSSMEGYY